MTNRERYFDHLSRFGAVSGRLCEPFLNIVHASPEAYLERSCKVSDDEVNPLRMNLWCRNTENCNIVQYVDELFLNYAKLTSLDLSLYHSVVGKGFCYDRVSYVVIGIDIRPRANASRLKVWYVVADYPEMEQVAFGMRGISPKAAQLKVHRSFLFGFDFGLRGGAALKVYPVLHDYEIMENESLLLNMFGVGFIDMVKRCRRVSLGYSTATENVTAHMVPYDTMAFVDALNIPSLTNAYLATGANNAIIAMSVEEIAASVCRNFNIYY